jgi:hypothetical protein
MQPFLTLGAHPAYWNTRTTISASPSLQRVWVKLPTQRITSTNQAIGSTFGTLRLHIAVSTASYSLETQTEAGISILDGTLAMCSGRTIAVLSLGTSIASWLANSNSDRFGLSLD